MITLEELCEALGGRWSGDHGSAPCPVCQPEGRRDQNALSLRFGDNGKPLLFCHKGCWYREVVDELRRLDLWPLEAADPDALARDRAESVWSKAEAAKRIWGEAWPIGGTLAEAYLRGRGITCALPQTLRYHPACWHSPTAAALPAMIAFVRGGYPAIHRTYLAPDGTKAQVEPAKMMLGSTLGGWVSLSPFHPRGLIVAEGIENALSLMCPPLADWFGPGTVQAGLSAAGVGGMRLPEPDPGDLLIIAPDGDAAGMEAAQQLSHRATLAGWSEVIVRRPVEGRDWNDHINPNRRTMDEDG